LRRATAVVLLLLLPGSALPQTPEKPASPPAWVAKSDANAKPILDVLARFGPEGASALGVEGFDEEILDLGPRLHERTLAATRELLATLQARLAQETDPPVRQDLQILVKAMQDQIEGEELNDAKLLPYFDLPLTLFQGIRALLDDQVAPARRARALVRLRRYAGLEAGRRPITVLAEERLRDRLAMPGLVGPFKGEIDKHLANRARYLEGIGKLFEKFQIAGYQEPLARLNEQVLAYEAFVKKEVVPRARTDFRLPPEIYAYQLRQVGVQVPPAELAARAHVSFVEIQNEMRALAPLVAKEKGLAATDYRDVIRELKKQQLVGEAILPHYQKRLRDLEEIIRREHVVTLPKREARIRLASEAESAAIPAPNLHPPRLIGNTGEMGEFVLPLSVPAKAGETLQRFDDFTFDAASWTLTVHEGRPGHELQFASLVEKGVSQARGLFAFNSVNVEGWALYQEAVMKPYMPLDGQLISLQHRLMRAARAFLDPELQMGQVQPEQALKFLMSEVVVSEPMARQEVDRYTFRAPGQATSYFYGYQRWMQLSSQVQFALGARFSPQRFHDFILSQGLLPPDVLSEAVMKEFVPAELARKE
jgi:hypothetical protein